MIGFLNQTQPVDNLYYRLYRENSCVTELNYLSLSGSLESLGVANNSFVFVKKDQSPPF